MKKSNNLMFAIYDFKCHQFIKNYCYFDGYNFHKFKNEHNNFIVYRQDDTTKEFNYYATITLKELLKFTKHHCKFLEKMSVLKWYRRDSEKTILNIVNS